MSSLQNLLPKQVEELISQNTIMFDIRRPSEWQMTGIIKNAIPLTFFDDYGSYDIEAWMSEFEKSVKSKDDLVVLICAHANRTRSVGDFLINQGYTNIAHLFGGMALWNDENREVVFL